MKQIKDCIFLLFNILSSVPHNNIVLQLEDILFDKDIEEW